MLFDLIRNNQKVLMALLVLLIFPAFAFFGISGYNTFFTADDAVAKVGELPITRYEYENARQAQMQNMRRMFGDQFDEGVFDTPEARSQMLDTLIDQRLVAVEAQDKRIVVPDEAVRNVIRETPDFLNDQGVFEAERYQNFLNGVGMTGPQYEARLRSNIAFESIPGALQATAFEPRSVSRKLVQLQQQKRKFRSREYRPEDFLDKAQATEEQAKKYYDENQAQFETPESVKIEYLVLSADELAEQVEVTDEKIREYYDQNQRKYLNPERRQISHILINMPASSTDEQKKTARDKAQQLLDRIRGGEDFAEVAKSDSQDPGTASAGGDLGFLERETVTKPFGDAAFALEVDQVSDVVETEDGLHLIKVTKIEPEAGMSFEQAKPKIEPALREDAGRDAFLDKADTFNNTVYEQPDSLAPTAEKLDMEVKTIETFTRNGAPDLAPDSPLRHPRVLRELFSEQSISKKENLEAISASDTQLVSARVLEHRPAAVQPFEKVQAEALSAVKAADAARLAREAGEADLKAFGEGKELAEFGEPQELTRGSGGLRPAATEALFGAASIGLPSVLGVDLGNAGYQILELIEVTDASDEDVDKSLDAIGAQAAAAGGQQRFQDFIQALKKRIPIERNLEALDRPSTGY